LIADPDHVISNSFSPMSAFYVISAMPAGVRGTVGSVEPAAS